MKGFKEELITNILPFWTEKMQDKKYGGFYGRMDGHNRLDRRANKGAILHARILWTFSAAYRLLKVPGYLTVARQTFDYIRNHFIDTQNGGAYWELDYTGIPVNTKKQTYVQGFMLYAFSEFFRATEDPEALDQAKKFFYLLEEKCKDRILGGYLEAFTCDWKPIEDMRLSEKDANEKKTMNTHLHVLEPYTNLCKIWNNEQLRKAHKELVVIFLEKIINKENYHLNLFFDEYWNGKSDIISYGHDIEASWLLYEAAAIAGDSGLYDSVKSVSLKISEAAGEGLLKDGSLSYEKENNRIDTERHWWVQAEGVVGFMYAYRNSGNVCNKEKAKRLWDYIRNQLIDRESGEWFWSRTGDGSINRSEDKAGFWKCPYHNSRMCMEMIETFNLE